MCYTPILLNTGLVVPCGRCLQCLSALRSQWIFRIKAEGKRALLARFITLTYNDDNLMITENGEMSLYKPDIQNYFKRVYKRERKVRYFAVGEYGERNDRPHYHAIVFNTSDRVLSEAWSIRKKEKGFVDLEEVNDNTIAYVTKYIININKNYLEKQRPFRLMSKGLGSNYLTEDVKEFYKNRMQGTVISDGGYLSVMPRYYKEKIFDIFEMQEVSRKNTEEAIKKRLSYSEMLDEKEFREKFCKEKSKSSRI